MPDLIVWAATIGLTVGLVWIKSWRDRLPRLPRKQFNIEDYRRQ